MYSCTVPQGQLTPMYKQYPIPRQCWQKTLAGVDYRRSSREWSEEISLGEVEKQSICNPIQDKLLPFAAVSDSELNFPLQLRQCCHCPVPYMYFLAFSWDCMLRMVNTGHSA